MRVTLLRGAWIFHRSYPKRIKLIRRAYRPNLLKGGFYERGYYHVCIDAYCIFYYLIHFSELLPAQAYNNTLLWPSLMPRGQPFSTAIMGGNSQPLHC